MHKPHNVSSHTISNLHICGDSEKLHNVFCVSILSLFCNHIENICNLFVIYGAKWAYICVGKLKIDVIRTHVRHRTFCRLDEATLFYIFTYLINWLINFFGTLNHLVNWEFWRFCTAKICNFSNAIWMQIDTVGLRSGGLLGCALGGANQYPWSAIASKRKMTNFAAQ